ncbi:MAG TPA: hypothetical protein VFF65_01195, partial [Phycisphaerales bacterium]|nr:hypothetical protein [Phycisphaerales bacterium]
MPVKTSAQSNHPHAADDPAGRKPAASAAFSHRHLLGLHGVGAGDIRTVLSLARRYAGHDADGSEDPAAWRSVLRGR